LNLNKREEEKCWFEIQNDIKERKKIKSIVPVSEAKFHEYENICSICFETFDIYYHDDAESWMLMNALYRNYLFFHPLCYLDYKD